jgi:starch synthase
MSNKKRILYVSQEILPFSPESSISNSCRYLAQSVHDKGKETRIFMPRYGKINERRHQLHEVIRLSGMNLIVNDTDHPLIIKVASVPQIRLQVYFIDNEEFFHRKAFFNQEDSRPFGDNDERMIFLTKGVLETVKKLGWVPDIIHCHGWFASLMPLYVKKLYSRDPHFADSKIVTSLYEDAFTEPLDPKLMEKVTYDSFSASDISQIEQPTHRNLLKLALQYSDAAMIGESTVDPDLVSYCHENDIPVFSQHSEPDYLNSADDFYEQVLLGKGELVD